MRNRWLICVLWALLLAGCSEPRKDYDTVRLDSLRYDIREPVHFTLVVQDSTARYDIHFATKTDPKFESPTINADVELCSPSGQKRRLYAEIPADKLLKGNVTGKYSGDGTCNVEWLWLEGVSLPEKGEWSVTLTILNRGPQQSYIIKGIHEIAINLRENERKR